jgi:putative tricarboxylic transport membrane protein
MQSPEVDSIPDSRSDQSAASRITRHLPALFLAAVCVLVLHEAATTLAEQGYASGTPISNAALYPRLLAGLLLFLLVVQVVADCRAPGPFIAERVQPRSGKIPLTALTGIAIVAYVALLPILGFILSTPLFVLGLLIMFGDRQSVTLLAVPLLITAGCMAVFQGLFNVNLPRGMFGVALNF